MQWTLHSGQHTQRPKGKSSYATGFTVLIDYRYGKNPRNKFLTLFPLLFNRLRTPCADQKKTRAGEKHRWRATQNCETLHFSRQSPSHSWPATNQSTSVDCTNPISFDRNKKTKNIEKNMEKNI